MAMQLVDALRANRKSRIAFVGAGGKSTAMFSLARQLPPPVICLTTTHLALDQLALADVHFPLDSNTHIQLHNAKIFPGVNLFTGAGDNRGRVSGLSTAQAFQIFRLAEQRNLPVLVEADGSRMLPFKAPADHEPPIPEWINDVVYIIGLSGIGREISEETVFRSEKFSELTGYSSGSKITLGVLEKYLLHPLGGLKNIPKNAHRTLIANQFDKFQGSIDELHSFFQHLTSQYDSLLTGSLQNYGLQLNYRFEKIAGIILAAGGSTRFGQAKQLITWRGKPLVRIAAETAIESGLSEVVVVTGFSAAEVQEAVSGLNVKVVFNSEWESGQSSSVHAGLNSLSETISAAMFLLADMPFTSVDLIKEIIRLQRITPAEIISPRVGNQRANPALFDRSTFNDFSSIKGDTGGRSLFANHTVLWVEWDDPAILVDIDTIDDYKRLIDEK